MACPSRVGRCGEHWTGGPPTCASLGKGRPAAFGLGICGSTGFILAFHLAALPAPHSAPASFSSLTPAALASGCALLQAASTFPAASAAVVFFKVSCQHRTRCQDRAGCLTSTNTTRSELERAVPRHEATRRRPAPHHTGTHLRQRFLRCSCTHIFLQSSLRRRLHLRAACNAEGLLVYTRCLSQHTQDRARQATRTRPHC